MRRIGELLNDSRKKKKITVKELSKETKIRQKFIYAIEKMDWDSLPEYPVVQGFVKSLASALGMSINQAVALLRRDYPTKKLPVSPRPDISERFNLTPKLVFLLGTAAIVLSIAGYLVFQYISFTRPPSLEVVAPLEMEEVFERTVVISGITDSDATVRVNNQPVLVGEGGDFEVELEISENTEEIIVVARSRAGKETLLRRTIINRIGEEGS